MTEQRLFSNQRLIRLIIPLVIEQALTILVGMCDGVMVSDRKSTRLNSSH